MSESFLENALSVVEKMSSEFERKIRHIKSEDYEMIGIFFSIFSFKNFLIFLKFN
jgi:hypothetical protein